MDGPTAVAGSSGPEQPVAEPGGVRLLYSLDTPSWVMKEAGPQQPPGVQGLPSLWDCQRFTVKRYMGLAGFKVVMTVSERAVWAPLEDESALGRGPGGEGPVQ